MKNRISYLITAERAAEFKAAVGNARNILLDMLREAKLDEIASGQNMGTEGGWAYAQKGLAIANRFPKLYDQEELQITEYQKDVDFADFLVEARREVGEMDDWVGILFALTGKDLMDQANYIRQRANDKRGINPEYITPSNEMNELYEKRASKAEETRKVNETIRQLREQLGTAK